MKMTPERVLALAEQARLGLTEAEAKGLATKLQSVLEAAAALQRVDTSGIDAKVHVFDHKNVLRADVVGESLPNDKALADAPDVQDGMFKVPRLHEQ